MDKNPTSLSGTGKVYGLLGTGADVQTTYYPGPSGTTSPNAGGVFRGGQAAYYDGSAASSVNSTWTIDLSNPSDPTLTFVWKNENNAMGTDFVVAWAMTCGNDTLLGNVTVPTNDNGGNVPLPGAFVLMGTVLFGAGGISRWRKGRVRAA